MLSSSETTPLFSKMSSSDDLNKTLSVKCLIFFALFATTLSLSLLICPFSLHQISPPPPPFLLPFENNTTNTTSPPPPSTSSWVSLQYNLTNYTSTLLSHSNAHTTGLLPCRDSLTSNVTLSNLSPKLPATIPHRVLIQSLAEDGTPRCSGGDYFETDLSGESWKSRPPILDNWNGSYTVTLQVHPDFSGEYVFTVVLLFRSFQGLKFSPERFKFRKEVVRMELYFYKDENVTALPELETCSGSSFGENELWSGRWTRHGRNDRCTIDEDGRFRCLPREFPCVRPWCTGALGALESNGWVYSSQCGFKIYETDAAWKCLNNKWLFFWGDSNHVDTIRNMLNFVLGLTDVKSVPRRFDSKFVNPKNSSQSVRITSIFNGHWNDTKNYLGLESLQNGDFRGLLWQYFTGSKVPDIMVLNSGLHDGIYWRSIRAFSHGAEYAAKFWDEVMESIKKRGISVPRIFYRTTIATGGYARDLAFNPSKMEAFNGVLLEKLKEKGLITGGVIDEFDMTFPWHFDNRCNDGVHYGREPAKRKWRDGEIGHQYFVDLMLVHALLNAMCNE